MNDRIRDLAEHCDFYVGNEHWDKSHEEQERLFLEKFAELIVRECADIAREVGTSTDPEDFALDRCYEIEAKIKEHFGID